MTDKPQYTEFPFGPPPPAAAAAFEMLPWSGATPPAIHSTMGPTQTMIAMATETGFDGAGRIRVSDVVMHEVFVKDLRTGEIIRKWRTILCTTDGQAFDTTSDVIKEDIVRMAVMYGPPPWPAGILVVCRQQKTRSGFIAHKVVPVLEEAE